MRYVGHESYASRQKTLATNQEDYTTMRYVGHESFRFQDKPFLAIEQNSH